jgi:hypothetical protein
MSTCEWLWNTEKQAVKLTVSATRQNPVDGDQGLEFEVFLDKLPQDQLGFHLVQSEHEMWSAWVVWEIEGGPHDGDLLIEILNSGKNGEDLPYVDETTGLRYWQVSVEKDEASVEMIKLVNNQIAGWNKEFGTQVPPIIDMLPSDTEPLTKFNDQIHKAELREHRHSGGEDAHLEAAYEDRFQIEGDE